MFGIRHKVMFVVLIMVCALALSSATLADEDHESPEAHSGLFYIDYRHLDGGADGVALINLDPDSPDFGAMKNNVEIGEGVLPHHLYFSRDEKRLYTTALGGANLYEIILNEEDSTGIEEIVAIDTGDNIVGEDMYFTEDGETYWVTFMGGLGGDKGGSVGVFDAETNELLETIVAPAPDEMSLEKPFILYPHGISANEDLGFVMVTSTIHYDLSTGIGNTVTLIDMETYKPVRTYLIGENMEDLTSPVETLLLRDEFPNYALVNTMIGGDIWVAGFDEETGQFDEFEIAFDGSDNEVGWTLEFYIGPGDDMESDDDKYLYVSHGQPGAISVFSLEDLPELTLVRTLPADAGAHHMAFFTTAAGREVVVVQNNLLNLNEPFPVLNAGTLMVVDIHTGDVLGTVDLPEDYGLMPESIESAHGHGHYYHH